MRTSLIVLALGSLGTLATACTTSTPTTPGTDELSGENGQDGEQAKADGADTFGYIAVHKSGAFDCKNPLTCISYELTRVNRSTIKCNDNAYHDQCGVKAVAWDQLNLSQTKINKIEAAIQAEAADPTIGTQVIVKGDYKIFVDFLAFVPTEVWIAQRADGNSDGTFVQIADRGVRCITAPCPVFEESRINSTRAAAIDGIDWDDSTDSALQEKVYDQTTKGGALVVGYRTYGTASAKLRSVGQVYLPVK